MERIFGDIWLVAAITVGLMISVITSESHSFKGGLARIASGLFCSLFLTDPILSFLERDPLVYGNALAGILAMSGYSIARILVNFDHEKFKDIIQAAKGKAK